jgi:hypothetical protein
MDAQDGAACSRQLCRVRPEDPERTFDVPLTLRAGDVLPRLRLRSQEGQELDSWDLRQRRALLILAARPEEASVSLLRELAAEAAELDWLEVSVWVLTPDDAATAILVPPFWNVVGCHEPTALLGEHTAALLVDRYGVVYAAWKDPGGAAADILQTVRLMVAECPECGGRLWQDPPGS